VPGQVSLRPGGGLPRGSHVKPGARSGAQQVLALLAAGPVFGVGLGGRAQPEPVHQPLVVVPVHPRGGDVLQVAERVERAVAERPGTLL
jgi:hypothetical protein